MIWSFPHQINLTFGRRAKRLLDSAEACVNHPVDGVRASPADSHNFYDCQVTAAFHGDRPTLDVA